MWFSRVVAGAGLGGPSGLDAELRHLLEEDGTLLGLWRVAR